MVKNPKLSSNSLSKLIDNKASPRTIRRELNKMHLYGRVACKKPFLSKSHKKSRLEWAYKYVNYSEEQWNRVLWSDESRFKLFGSDGRCYVWRTVNSQLEEKNLSSTVKFGGGSIMVWGCFGNGMVGNLKIVNENLNTLGYIDLLSTNLLSSVQKCGMESYIFQQDNAPCHKSKRTMEYILQNNVEIMKWPPQSPDLNPIENVWGYMGIEKRNYHPKNKKDLELILMEIWNNIPSDFLQKLIKGMHTRCLEVIKAKGGHISY